MSQGGTSRRSHKPQAFACLTPRSGPSRTCQHDQPNEPDYRYENYRDHPLHNRRVSRDGKDIREHGNERNDDIKEPKDDFPDECNRIHNQGYEIDNESSDGTYDTPDIRNSAGHIVKRIPRECHGAPGIDPIRYRDAYILKLEEIGIHTSPRE